MYTVVRSNGKLIVFPTASKAWGSLPIVATFSNVDDATTFAGMSRGHWVTPSLCKSTGRCFHLERSERHLRISANVARGIKDTVRRDAYLESFINKAIREELLSTVCPIYGTDPRPMTFSPIED